jgi:hypothetical protein
LDQGMVNDHVPVEQPGALALKVRLSVVASLK